MSVQVCVVCRQVWRLPGVAPCFGRSFLLVRNHSSSYPTRSLDGSSYPLPWPQHSVPFSVKEPFMNTFLGLFFLRRIANTHGYTFKVSEFLQGAKEAVFAVAGALSSPERRSILQSVLSPHLYTTVRQSLESLPDGSRMHLDVESIRHVQLSCVNSVVGATEPGDEHPLEWLGQRVIASKSELQALERADTKITFRTAREIGMAAAGTHMEFQLGVSFKTKEKFAVLDSGGQLVEGSNQFKDGYHLWRFGSNVSWEGDDYPFSWTILDINDHLMGAVD